MKQSEPSFATKQLDPSAVGFIGLGVMGSILVERLCAAGIPVIVYNRTAGKANVAVRAGASLVESPLAVARHCRRVFIALTGPLALREVLFGDGGACTAYDTAMDLICDLSTQDPAVLRHCQTILARRGITIVEAPMAGSVHDATRGTLKFLQGGDREKLDELAFCFRHWGPEPTHFGELGHAATAKLALNLLLGLMAAGLGDALALLRRSGVSEQGFVEVLAASGLRSPLYDRLWQRCKAGDYEARFALGNLAKDIQLCHDHPAWQGAPLWSVQGLASFMSGIGPAARAMDYSYLLAHDVHPSRRAPAAA